MNISDLRKGDRAFVINGRQSSAFPSTVEEILPDRIVVNVPDKGMSQSFRRSDGKSMLESAAELVAPDDWRVSVLNAGHRFRALHLRVQQTTKAFRINPSGENGILLAEAVHQWREFSLLHPDQLAIRVSSIAEYQAGKALT